MYYTFIFKLDLIGDSIYKNVHPDDQKELSELLGSGNPLVDSLFEDILNADSADEGNLIFLLYSTLQNFNLLLDIDFINSFTQHRSRPYEHKFYVLTGCTMRRENEISVC